MQMEDAPNTNSRVGYAEFRRWTRNCLIYVNRHRGIFGAIAILLIICIITIKFLIPGTKVSSETQSSTVVPIREFPPPNEFNNTRNKGQSTTDIDLETTTEPAETTGNAYNASEMTRTSFYLNILEQPRENETFSSTSHWLQSSTTTTTNLPPTTSTSGTTTIASTSPTTATTSRSTTTHPSTKHTSTTPRTPTRSPTITRFTTKKPGSINKG